MAAIKGKDMRLTVHPKCPPLVLTFGRVRGRYTKRLRWHFALCAGTLRQHWVADETRTWWWGWRQVLRNADQLRARWRRDNPGETFGPMSTMTNGWL